jgi:uncharacterized protein YcfJ
VKWHSDTRQVKAALGVIVNNTALAGLIVGGVVVAAAAGIAANSGFNPLQKYATVVAVEPAFDTNRTPRTVCGDEATLAQARAEAAAAPTVGDESAPAPAPTEATPPEAATPPAEDKAAAKTGEEGGKAGEEQCLTVYDTSSVPAGFDVTYELDGVQKVVRMDHDPGKRIPVEDGEIVVSRS